MHSKPIWVQNSHREARKAEGSVHLRARGDAPCLQRNESPSAHGATHPRGLAGCGGWLGPFDGIKADIRYTYRRGEFEQDVILLEKPALPASFAADSTRIEVWTEFIESPPVTVRQGGRAGMTDDTVDFGEMKTGIGRAFALASDSERPSSTPVAKRWFTLDGRTFLVEAARFLALKAELERLPAARRQAKSGPPAQRGERVFPSAPPARQAGISKPGGSIQVAAREHLRADAKSTQAGLVLDYDLQNSLTNYTFHCNTTYVASGIVNLHGTTTFEGGTVIKFKATNTASLSLSEPAVWETAIYRPAIFTAVDDHSVGVAITTNALSGFYGGGYVRQPGNPEHVRVSHARTAFKVTEGLISLRHAQIVHCDLVLDMEFGSSQTTLENVLLTDIGAVRSGPGSGSPTLSAKHLTVYACPTFSVNQSLDYADFLNSIFASVGWGTTTMPALTSCVGVSGGLLFQTVGAGAYYLSTNNYYRDLGSALTGPLATEIKSLTTYPPIVLTNPITADVVLAPQALRDTGTPDLGYHYPPIDFLFRHPPVTNATLTVRPGTVLAFSGSSMPGIYLQNNSRINAAGSPTNLARMVRYNSVQESSTTNWSGNSASVSPASVTMTFPPILEARFTQWAIPGGHIRHFDGNWYGDASFHAADSVFHGGKLWSERATVGLTNCLFTNLAIV